ncbi:MAG: peptidyl-prolyl cis-trans isomerase [Bacteroidales bacterium]|nr:peptidyl-prolyl cis-trans isomerase [Bacteroidales bacterium]
MKKIVVAAFFVCSWLMAADLIVAQEKDNRTLLAVADENVPVSEFLRVYTKNSLDTLRMDEKSLRDYMELYINFRLKVKEAETLGMDTVTSFRDELAGYRKQLAEQYFENEEMIDILAKEAWERGNEDIRASHILVKVGQYALPEDTLAAWNSIMKAHERLVNGEAFENVARDVSEDPYINDRVDPRSGKTVRGNKGDIGYFTVFDMIYPFETAAYKTKTGYFSKPVRTKYGYHIVKVTDRIPSYGEVQLAHLYLKIPDSATHDDSLAVKMKIDSLYNRITGGEKFEDMVKEYSQDPGSSSKGGLLPKLRINRLVPEFVEALKKLPDTGRVTEPLLTNFGWHILKYISKTEQKPFEELQGELKRTIQKDARAEKSRQSVISGIKNDYGINIHQNVLSSFYPLVDSSVYNWKWEIPEGFGGEKTVFEIGDAEHSLNEFAAFFKNNQKIGKDETIIEFVNKTFEQFVNDRCIAYEDTKLEDKYPDFKALVKEYRDGILLFDLTEKNVWSKAVKDTTGLKKYFSDNYGKYTWGERLNASVFSCTEPDYAEQVKGLASKGLSDEEIISAINGDSLDVVQVKSKLYSRNENDIIDGIKWEKGITETIENNGRYLVVVVHGKIAPGPKSFDEARGFITADYQTFLEEKWIQELRNKYPVKVNEEVFSSIIIQ